MTANVDLPSERNTDSSDQEHFGTSAELSVLDTSALVPKCLYTVHVTSEK